VISSFNPIDLARIICLIHLDASALMGYTGAIFQQYFQSFTGSFVSLAALTFWTLAPLGSALYKFKRKDF
jgi:Cu-processing system permease protein